MTEAQLYRNPEPVPAASQLAVLPFLAGVDGYLREDGDVEGLRLTFHRTMSRLGEGYLQQVCAYLPEPGNDWRGKVGRTFPVDDGIMGAAYGSRQVWRTRSFAREPELRELLAKDTIGVGNRALSWLAVPFLGPRSQVVLILFAECAVFNFFARDERVHRVVAMGNGFCRLFDWLQHDPFGSLRNFPLDKGDPIKGALGAFIVQEPVPTIQPPHFKEVPSFNYEAAVA